jgi:hypothetical protein
VALAQAAQEAATDNLTSIDQVVDYLRNRVAQGATPEADLIRAQVERDRAATELTMADVDLLRAQVRPSSLSWQRSRCGPRTRRSARLVARARARAASGEFTTYALAHRPDLLASRAKAAAASSAIHVERSMIVRQLGASFGYKRMAGTNGNGRRREHGRARLRSEPRRIQRATSERLASDLETQWLERSIVAEHRSGASGRRPPRGSGGGFATRRFSVAQRNHDGLRWARIRKAPRVSCKCSTQRAR